MRGDDVRKANGKATRKTQEGERKSEGRGIIYAERKKMETFGRTSWLVFCDAKTGERLLYSEDDVLQRKTQGACFLHLAIAQDEVGSQFVLLKLPGTDETHWNRRVRKFSG